MKQFIIYVERIGEKRGWKLFFHAACVLLLAWVPAMALANAVYAILPGPPRADMFENIPRGLLVVIVVAPLVETLVMRYAFMFLKKFVRDPVKLCACSALFWGLGHIPSEAWGADAAWVFFILGLCYQRLEQISLWRAIWITVLLHAAFNGLSAAVYFSMKGLGI